MQKASKLYGNVGGTNRKLKSVWSNVNGVVRRVYSGKPILTLQTYKTEGDLSENLINFWVSSKISDGNYIINFKFTFNGGGSNYPDHELRYILVIEGLNETQYYRQDGNFLSFPSDILLKSRAVGSGGHQFEFSIYGEDKTRNFIEANRDFTKDDNDETIRLKLLHYEYTNSYPYKKLYLDFYDRCYNISKYNDFTLQVTIPAGMMLKYSETGEMLPIKYEY